MSIPYTSATDLLGQTAPLTFALKVPLLGVPVVYSSNSPAVIKAAGRALAIWRDLPPELVAPGPPARVAVIVHPIGPGDPKVPPAERFVFRAHGDSFLAASGGNLLGAQMAASVATAFVTPELAADEPNLRHNVIECLGFLLVSHRDRTPVHAAAVVRGGRAVLLAGPSAAGKSTLCYACVRAGFGLLAEDTVSVSLEGGMRLWGHPSRIHLLPDAPRLFPELAGLAPRVQANGKLKLAVDVAALGPDRLVTHADRAVVCFVERAAGQASRLAPMDAGEAAAALSDPREPGFDLLRDRAPTVAHALTAGGAYRLTVGADPAAAAALIAHLAES
ncbi:MAG TPA: hypothetical protein PKD53_30525 [Chloroflexaceae bacterium]|nr:hypothetical protein [Chloroflexaceae bacterium]